MNNNEMKAVLNMLLLRLESDPKSVEEWSVISVSLRGLLHEAQKRLKVVGPENLKRLRELAARSR